MQKKNGPSRQGKFPRASLFQGCIPVGEFKNQHPIAEDGYYELGFVLLVILLRIVPSLATVFPPLFAWQ